MVAVSAAAVGTATLVVRSAVKPTEGSAKAAAVNLMTPVMALALTMEILLGDGSDVAGGDNGEVGRCIRGGGNKSCGI